jgi:hypothetical protein
MPASRRIFTVFLASPSDLDEERSIAESGVDFVNDSVANRLGWQIDLRRWEATPPSFGRPQDSINPLVNSCDLFVGLLWERWGQPTGGHTSGFEEEFELAKTRRTASGAPEIWLMFKEVDPNKLKDPGDQLKKVIEFRELQKRLNEVKYTTVTNSEDWKTKLQLWLLQYIMEFNSQHPEASTQRAIAAPAPNSLGVEANEDTSPLGLAASLPPQLKAASAALSSAAAEDARDLFDRASPLSEFEVARIFLLSATLISRRYTNFVLGTHEINLLYKHRGELDAAIDERIEILRSVVGAGADPNPGWFWFQDLDEQLIFDQLFKFATDDVADDVRIGALGLLTLSRFAVPRESWSSLPLRHESWNVRASAFNYLAEMGDEATIDFLDTFATDTEDSLSIADAHDARFRILSRLSPDIAFAEAISKEEFVSSERLKLLEASAPSASEHTLLQGVESSWEQIRKVCARELTRRHSLPTEVAHRLVQDPSLAVRAIALASLAEDGRLPGPHLVREALKDPDADSRGSFGGLAGMLGGKTEEAPDADSIIVTVYSKQSTDDALAAVDWFSFDGHLAYKALALNHFELVEPNIIQDIAAGFSRIKEESIRRIEAASGLGVAQKWKSAFEKADDFIASQFKEAALLGIAKHGLLGAAEIAKPYLSQDRVGLRDAALKVVCNFGDSGYESELLRIAKETYGERQEEATSGALMLSSNPAKTAAELLGSESADLAKVAFSWMTHQNRYDFSDVFKDFLHDEDGGLRIQSVFWLSKRLQRSDLEAVLLDYVESGTYYYDVVTSLDRLLYAPPRLRESFARELEQQQVHRPRQGAAPIGSVNA